MSQIDRSLLEVYIYENLQMLEGCETLRDDGIEVDEHMLTALPDVYAAGDIAIAPDFEFKERKVHKAVWINAVRQGKVAGANMSGGSDVYDGSRTMNSIRLFGLDIASLGITSVSEADGLEENILREPGTGEYLKYVFDKADGRLRGVSAVGNISGMGVFADKLGTSCAEGFLGSFPRT